MKVDDDAQSKVTLALKFRIKFASDLGIFQVGIFLTQYRFNSVIIAK